MRCSVLRGYPARRVTSFQLIHQFLLVTNCPLADSTKILDNASMVALFTLSMKRFHAMFGLGHRSSRRLCPDTQVQPTETERFMGIPWGWNDAGRHGMFGRSAWGGCIYCETAHTITPSLLSSPCPKSKRTCHLAKGFVADEFFSKKSF